jgi:hypothetical protein
VLIILILVLTGGGDDGDGGETEQASGEAREVSVEELEEVAAGIDQPVYWAGEQEDKRYELTETADGNIFIRYLDPDVEVGSTEVASLTVGTYPLENAYGATQKAGREKGALKGETPDGGLVVTNQNSASSVYIAYPGTDVQIEVFDPNPQVAFETATSGDIEPIQ